LTGTRVEIHEQTTRPLSNGWVLCFQWCTYHYIDGSEEQGYRFIYKDDNGKLRPQRGQARIPSISIAQRLIKKAIDEDWGRHRGAPLT
jgi:hypothetical protein